MERHEGGVDGVISANKHNLTELPPLFPAARRILLPLLPEICDSAILLSDALRHGASTGWFKLRPIVLLHYMHPPLHSEKEVLI